MSDAEPVLVVGGGPAGTSCALALARAGRPVTLFERGRPGALKVCGEFLGPEAITALDALQFPWSEADAVDYRCLRLRAGDREAVVPLPHAGRGVRRTFLDAWLLTAAARAGAQVWPETTVRHAAWDAARARFELRTDAGRCLAARALFLATGKHALGDLHGRQAHDGGRLVGLKVDFAELPPALARAYADTLELFFLPGGYGGVARVGRDRLTVCLVLQRSGAAAWARGTAALLELLVGAVPALGGLLHATPLTARPSAIAPLPYGHVEPLAGPTAPPLFPLGDQFAVLPSLTGTGIGLALATGNLAARAWLRAEGRGLGPYIVAARAAAVRVRRRALPLHRVLQHAWAARLAVRLLGGLPALGSFAAAYTRLGPVRSLGPLVEEV